MVRSQAPDPGSPAVDRGVRGFATNSLCDLDGLSAALGLFPHCYSGREFGSGIRGPA